ncbi:MAG TPA: competence/damage-inducible protein A [Gemmatimonadales bacterium]|nr:competence/damage-inducible protein A [Gemmatimonadales bacterium]
MKLEVVTIGTELLLGAALDTNALDLGTALAAAGIDVTRRTTVSDKPAAVADAVRGALERTGAALTTGGLGPTRDDLTKQAVAGLFGRPLVLDEGVLRHIEERFRRFGRRMTPSNRVQAEIPQGAVVLPNPRGTAPGIWLEDDAGRLVIMLPGVPVEMRGLLVEQVLPRLVARALAKDGAPVVVRSRTVRTTGVPESALAERIAAIEDGLGPLTLAYLPSIAGVDLRLTAWEMAPDQADRLLGEGVGKLQRELGDRAYGVESTDLAGVVLDLLRKSGRKLAVAESCTGGILGARLTAIPGSSDVFVGGVIAYSDDVKTGMLDVPRAILEQHGAVSEQTVRALAEGAARAFGVDCALAVTGIAGPGGGSPEKPVGTVWIAARHGAETRALQRQFLGERDEIRARSAQAALALLHLALVEA